MRALLTRHAPDSPVCFGAGGARDAAQLAAHATAIARALPATPARARVVLACSDRYHFSAGLAAIWARGAIAELPANGQPATVHALARRAGVVALLHDRDEASPAKGDAQASRAERLAAPSAESAHRPAQSEWAWEVARLREHGVRVLDVRAIEDPGARAALPVELALAGESPALIAYTSGSTGQPMPHEKALDQLISEPEAHLAGFALGGCRIVAAVPPYHIYGLLFGVLVPLLGGGSMSRSAPLLPAELLRELESAGADVLVAVPPHLKALAEYDPPAWPRLHRVFSSAAPLPAAVSNALRARGLIVTEILGSTETGGIASRDAPDAPWRGLPGVKTRIDPDSALSVDAPWLAPGAPRPQRTADRVEPAGEGFRHLGRSDAVVKIGGRRIDLGEIESRLKQSAGVRDARVLAVETAGVRGLELYAVVESDAAQVAALKRELSAHIDAVAVPRRFRVLSSLPRSATGKVSRSELLALFDVWSFPREPLAAGKVRLSVPAQCGFFRGHFEHQPILPGVVQLQHFALREARRQFPELGALARMTRVKFKRSIGPGEVLELTLEPKSGLRVQFTLESNGEPAASGLLHFRAAR